MVDGVRPGGIVRSLSQGRDGARVPDGPGRFAVDVNGPPLARNPGVSGAPLIGMESMLVLQGLDEAPERNRRARKRGIAMLAALTDLQRSLLMEDDPALALRSLSELAADGASAADPALGAILRAVELRARVEVARRESRRG